MVAPVNDLSVEYLRECFEYDPDSGNLRWLCRPESHFTCKSTAKAFNTRLAGSVAGTLTATGRVQIRICGLNRLAHRIAWAMYTGEYPEGDLLHINGDYTDNSIGNLDVVENRKYHNAPC